MKFGHYLQDQQKTSFFSPLTDSECELFWVDYKQLKKSIKGEEGDFVKKWESQLTSLASTVQKFPSQEDDACVREYIRINREALRKSAKKYDKKVASPSGLSLSEKLMTHMADYILATCSAFGLVDDKVDEDKPRGPQPFITKERVLGFLLLALFTCIVAGESIAYDQAINSLSDDSPLCEPSVVLLESFASVIVGTAILFAMGGRKEARIAFRLQRLYDFAPAGIARSCGDICTVLAISYVDPSTYMVVSQSKLLVTGLLAYVLLPTHPNLLQWYALGFIATGIVIFKFSHGSSDSSTSSTFMGYLLLALSVLCKGFASSWMDRVLKKGADESTIGQSVSTSICGLLPSAIFFWAIGHRHIDNPLRGFTWITVALATYLLVKNWYGSYIIKTTSAVMKYVLYAVAVLLTYVASVLLFGEEFQFVALLAAFIVCGAVLLFGSAKAYKKPKGV